MSSRSAFVSTIAAFAKEYGITHVVLGRSRRLASLEHRPLVALGYQRALRGDSLAPADIIVAAAR